jgi:hypothetical protein
MRQRRIGSIAAGVSFALLVACAGGDDTNSPLAAPSASSRVLTTATVVGQAGDNVPNQGELEVCNFGVAAQFDVVIGNAPPIRYSHAAGECKVVAIDITKVVDVASTVTVTDVPSPSYNLLSIQRTDIQFAVGTTIDVVGTPFLTSDPVTGDVNFWHGVLLVYHHQAVSPPPPPPPPPPVCDFITFGRLVTSLNGNKVVISGNIGGNQPGGGILSEFHVEANGVDNHVADVATYGPISSGPLSGLTNSRISTGTAKNGVAVEVRMWDGGEPGKGTDIVYVKLNGVEILGPNGQYLDQGNVQFHAKCRGPGG